MTHRFRLLAAAMLLPLTACSSALQVPLGAPAPLLSAAPGMVSAADPRAAEAGAEILRLGGSAADAAIATMLALTVVEPQSSGIGGGGFFVTSDSAGHVETINGREKAPAAATPNWLMVDGQPRAFKDAQLGGLSTGVPGNVALAVKAHERHGKLAWARLFDPAIRYAEQGFVITPRLYGALDKNKLIAAFGAGARIFYDGSGNPLPVGARVRNPALAAFLRQLAGAGPSVFYGGDNARAIVAAVSTSTHNPAPMTLADVTAMSATDEAPVCGTYRGYRICGMGPPSSGATTVFAILKQLERFDLRALGKDNPLTWHLIAESQRLAYADRAQYLGDPAFVRVPVAGLTDSAYLAARSALIDPHSTMAQVTAGMPPGASALNAPAQPQVEHGTSHFAIADGAGNVVSYTSTIESGFGSGLVVNGYYLNNELTDFSFAPTGKDGALVANRVEGGKRPRSSMSPSIVFAPDGRIRLVVGAAGGSTIIVQVAKAIIGVIDFGLSAQDALALSNIYSPEGIVYVEEGTPLAAMIGQLGAFGHRNVKTISPSTFKANAIEWTGDHWVGAADPRSEGKAVAQ
ncbi:MAG: gamma-glutamyltransferase [Sphingomicrobium sp.]